MDKKQMVARYIHQDWKSFLFHPASITFIVLSALVIMITATSADGMMALVRIGSRYNNLEAKGTEGYDGQFVYYIARNPNPLEVQQHLDVPAYRYQRILYPLLVWLITLGDIDLIPWALPIIGILSQVLGTWVIVRLFDSWGINRWYALIYGLWVGFTLAVRLDLPEPLAFCLVLLGIYFFISERHVFSHIFLGLALFAKEVTVLFLFAILLTYVIKKQGRRIGSLFLISILPFAAFQVSLWYFFGEYGFGSGGAMATPFEIIPFMGFMRIAIYSPMYFLMMVIVFSPTIIIPSIWGICNGIKYWINNGANVKILFLLLNSISIVFLPFSTYRETGGLLRFACGLILSILIFSGYYRLNKVLNYCFFLLVLNVILLKQ